MSLLYYCSACGKDVDWIDNPPPWCQGCGADFKPGGKSPPTSDAPAEPTPVPKPSSLDGFAAVTAGPAASATPRPIEPTPLPPPLSIPQAEKPARPPGIFGAPIWPTSKAQWIGLIAVVVAGVSAPLFVKFAKAFDKVEKFNEMRNVWIKKPSSSDPNARYIRGKVLPYGMLNNSRGAEVDRELYDGLPEELRPQTPDEVGTLAWVEWRLEEITTKKVAWQIYHVLGYQRVCTVTLIDRRVDKKLASRTFRGSDPTKGARNENGYGDKPIAEILAYLKSLPRQN